MTTTTTGALPRYDVERIPAELKALDRWCGFHITVQPNGKTKKIPLVSGAPGLVKAECDNPSTLRPFDLAVRDAELRGLHLAFAFDPSLPYFFLDGDDVVTQDGDDIRPDVREVRDALDTYTEVSASGTGLHIIGRGAFPENAANRPVPEGCHPWERYPLRGGRFCVFTGNVVPGYEVLRDRGDVLARLFPSRPPSTNGSGAYHGAVGELLQSEGEAIVQWAAPYWTDGRRHPMALHLSGYLGKQGVSREQAVRIIETCAVHDGDPGAKVHACHDSYDALEAGSGVSGWQGLHDVCGLTADQLLPLDALLSGFWRRNHPRVEPAEAASDSGASTKTPASRIITADALSTKSFPEPKWAVPGVVPDGATVLVGAPKKGKSWLLLGLGIAIAAGGRALGKIAVDAGDVLLLCLEDNQRRLQERLWRVLDGEPAPARLHLVTAWPRLGEGADAELDAWLTLHPATRLVGIDVLARLRPPSNTNGNLYQLDYWTLASLKAIADKHGVALVVVHHSRKASADDPLDTISGTAGLAGAADTALILTREKGRADGNLYVRGRDVPEAEYALGFDPVTCQWDLLGDAAAYRVTTGRADVLALLRTRGPLTPKDIADALGADRGNMRVLLHRMKNAGELVVSGGIYHVPPSSPVTGVTGVTPPEKWRNHAEFPCYTPCYTPRGCNTPCNRQNPRNHAEFSDPVTPVTPVTPPVTPERDGEPPALRLNGHPPPHQARPNTVRVSIA